MVQRFGATTVHRFNVLCTQRFMYAIGFSSDRSILFMGHMQNCSQKHKCPIGAYQLSETVLDCLKDFKIVFQQELRLFSPTIAFNFHSISVLDNTLRNTELASWIGTHVPISMSIASNLLEDPIFICNEDSYQQVRDYVSGVTNLAEKSTLLLREKLIDFVLQFEEKQLALRQLVPVKDDNGPSWAQHLFVNKVEADDMEDEDLDIARQRSKLKIF